LPGWTWLGTPAPASISVIGIARICLPPFRHVSDFHRPRLSLGTW
jgi:hypothetical protein